MAGKGLRIDFSGHKELLENMKNLSEEIQTKAKSDAIKEAASIVRDAAQIKAPVSKGSGTHDGHLRDNIIVETVEDNELVTEAKVGPNKKAFHGMFVEYGTRRMRARPYLRPAFDENRDKIDQAIAETLQEAIDKAVKDVVDTGNP